MPQGLVAEKDFRWRGGDVSRIEALADGVFALCVAFVRRNVCLSDWLWSWLDRSDIRVVIWNASGRSLLDPVSQVVNSQVVNSQGVNRIFNASRRLAMSTPSAKAVSGRR